MQMTVGLTDGSRSLVSVKSEMIGCLASMIAKNASSFISQLMILKCGWPVDA